MKTKRIAGYVRVSHDEQKKFGYSIQAQNERIKTYAKETKSQLVEIYVDEGFTATKMKRPELLKMLDNLDKFDVVVFTRLDRFSRNVLQANKMVELMEEYSVSIKSIEESDIDTTTADGKFQFDLRVSLAEREAKKTSERIKSVFEFKIKNGQPINGIQPYGYKVETVGSKEKKIVKDESTQHIVEEIFKYFAIHHSARKTMIYINNKYELNRSYNTYLKIITDTVYYGEYEGNPNYYVPYISKNEYIRNQKRLNANIKHGLHKNIYLFTSLIRCPVCNSKMVGKHSKRINVKGNEVEYFSYICSKRKKEERCSNTKTINENKILNYLLNNIEELAKNHIAEVMEVKPSKEEKTNDKLIKEIMEEIDNLNYMFQKKRIDDKKYDREYEALEKQLASLKIEKPVIENDIAIVEEFLNSGWKEVYHSLTKENQRALWRNVIKEIVLTESYDKIDVIFL